MIALKSIRTAFIWLSLHPNIDPTTPKWKKCLRIFIAFGIPLNIVAFIIGSIRYFYVHFATNLEDGMFALLPIIYGSYLTYDLLVAYVFRYKITATFAELQNIYNQCK